MSGKISLVPDSFIIILNNGCRFDDGNQATGRYAYGRDNGGSGGSLSFNINQNLMVFVST